MHGVHAVTGSVMMLARSRSETESPQSPSLDSGGGGAVEGFPHSIQLMLEKGGASPLTFSACSFHETGSNSG